MRLGELKSYACPASNIDLFIRLHVTKEIVLTRRLSSEDWTTSGSYMDT